MFSGESFGLEVLGWMPTAFTFVAVLLIGVYISDITQTKQAIRRNYPVISHFRYYFEHIGTFFRQYFFTMDREEMPFNRAQRSWVYRAAKDIENMVAFGSTRDLKPIGTVLFVNTAFPTLGKDAINCIPIVIGEGCLSPFHLQGEADVVFQIGTEKYCVRDKDGSLSDEKLRKVAAHENVRIVQTNGTSIMLDDLYPNAVTEN